MIQIASPRWESRRTEETREVEKVLRDAEFDQVDAYRYNSASIRLRVIDPRFAGLSGEKRVDLIEPHLDGLPEQTQADLMSLFLFAPAELEHPDNLTEFVRYVLKNEEFEDPSSSM